MKYIVILITFILMSCDITPNKYENTNNTKPKAEEKENKKSGIGMTYTGKLGIDIGNGLVVPFDGKGVGLGFGF